MIVGWRMATVQKGCQACLLAHLRDTLRCLPKVRVAVARDSSRCVDVGASSHQHNSVAHLPLVCRLSVCPCACVFVVQPSLSIWSPLDARSLSHSKAHTSRRTNSGNPVPMLSLESLRQHQSAAQQQQHVSPAAFPGDTDSVAANHLSAELSRQSKSVDALARQLRAGRSATARHGRFRKTAKPECKPLSARAYIPASKPRRSSERVMHWPREASGVAWVGADDDGGGGVPVWASHRELPPSPQPLAMSDVTLPLLRAVPTSQAGRGKPGAHGGDSSELLQRGDRAPRLYRGSATRPTDAPRTPTAGAGAAAAANTSLQLEVATPLSSPRPPPKPRSQPGSAAAPTPGLRARARSYRMPVRDRRKPPRSVHRTQSSHTARTHGGEASSDHAAAGEVGVWQLPASPGVSSFTISPSVMAAHRPASSVSAWRSPRGSNNQSMRLFSRRHILAQEPP